MVAFLSNLFSTDSFMPHGHCYLWQPGMVWLQVLSNAGIGLSYVAISCTLAYLVYRIRNLPFQWIYLAFGLFIISCGVTHFMDIVTVWTPVYWLDGIIRVITAVASVGTAIILPFLIPQAVALAQGTKVAREKGIRLESAYRQLGEVFEKTKEVDQLKTQFFANVSHELRTPLALILGPAERMRLDQNLNEGQRRNLEVMSRNARALLKHVNDLLDVAKLEAGKMKVKYAQTDLSRLIRVVAGNFDGLASERHIDFTVSAPPALLVEVDPEMLQRILLNLLSNAFKFTPDMGEIKVLAEERKSSVRVSVADSGLGIPENMREAVFERFRQLDLDVTRTHGGTGLGLSIVKELVDLQHGQILVGQAPGGGALFTFELPLQAPPGVVVRSAAGEQLNEVASLQALEALRQTTKRFEAVTPQAKDIKSLVLVVEDNFDMNQFISGVLSAEFGVESAFNGKEGLEKAIKTQPDLILSDIMMPVMSGDQMLAELRKYREFAGTPVLLLTAKADDELRNRLLRQGAQDYVIKPFSSEEVLTRVRNLVTMKRARDVLQRELDSQLHDLETLAREAGLRKRELQTAVHDLRLAKEEAERASSAKSVFLGMVSHELKTPMTSLKLQLQILKRVEGKKLSPSQLALVDKLDHSSDRSLEMMNTLLEYTRLQSGKVELISESFELSEVVADLVEVLRPFAQEKGLSFESTSAPNLPLLQSDRLLVQIVLRNLITNAIKYTDMGSVKVRLSFEQGMHRVAIKDTGPGIPREQQALIFQPFKQLGALDKKSKSGFGLGLAIARDSIHALGGTIEISSELGQGSVFTASFPPLEASPVEKDKHSASAA